VRLTKETDALTAPLTLDPDPRAKHSADDRRAQFDLAMSTYHLLGDMTYAVERINSVRLALDDRASRLSPGEPLTDRLRSASTRVDGFRKKIVATKEGGMITGEERLREYLVDLYGQVVFYEGHPSRTQAERADALKRELAAVVKEFDAWAAKELDPLNASITEKKLDPVKPVSLEEWRKSIGQK
jgi:hypothetical protein